MLQYVARRLLIAIPMLLGAMSIVFFAMRVLPGDPCVAMMGDQATTEALASCTKNLGLNRPLAVQYVDYLWRSIRFDFGTSFRQGYPVNEYIGRMFPHTFVLVMASAVVAALVGIPIGIIVGRLAWSTTAHTIGVLSVYRFPVLALCAIVPVSIAVTVLVSLVPARRAARLSPATILRSE